MTEPMTDERLAETRCWIVRQQGESDASANERHFNEQEAREEATRLAEEDVTVTVEQLSAPCVTLTCSGCGYRIDEDDEGIIHFESIKQAHEYVLGYYRAPVFAGDLLLKCSDDCGEV